MSYQYPEFNKMSLTCKRLFNSCDASTNVSLFAYREPVGCWKDWAEACAVRVGGLTTGLQILIGIFIIIAILSLIGNSIVCIVFCLYEQLRLVKHYFVINLAVVDNVLVVISIPMYVAFLLSESEDTALCRAQTLIDIFCGTVSIVSLAVISIERYFAVVQPLHYESRVTQHRAVLIIIFTWFYSALVSLITLLSFGIPNSPASRSSTCLFFGGEFVIFVTIASFILPVAVMAWAYWNIFLVAHRHAVQIQAVVQSTQQLPQMQSDTRPQVKMRGELKAAKTLTIIMGTHILCWCPLFVYFCVISFCRQCRNPSSTFAHYVIFVLRYSNTLANPIIYTGINRQFRAAIRRFVLRVRGTEDLNSTACSQAT